MSLTFHKKPVPGLLHSVTEGNTVFTYGFESGSGRLGTTAMAIGGTDKLAVAKSYDHLGRLLSIATAAPPAAAATSSHAYTYNAAGQRTQAVLETGEHWDYSYDALGQVIGGVKRTAGGAAIPGYTFGYAFDQIGNRTGTSENGASSVYTANSLNQYTQRTVPGVAQVRGRAAVGAVVSVTPPGGLPLRADRQGGAFHRNVPLDNTAGSVEATLAVTAVLPGQGPNGEDIVAEQTRAARVEGTPQTFSHDDDGNLLSDGRWAYAWNGENRLVSATSATARLEFLYDHRGRRVEKRTYSGTPGNWTLGETRRFLYDGWNLVAEFTLSGTTLSLHRSHLWGLDLSQSLQAAGGVGGLLRTTLHDTTDTDCYPVYDGNGNIVRYLDPDGAILAVLEYSPFGRPIEATGTAVPLLPFRFSTKFRDDQTELYYYGYRYYEPETGRWLNRDPIGENGGINTLAAMRNSAPQVIDSLGLSWGWPKGLTRDKSQDLWLICRSGRGGGENGIQALSGFLNLDSLEAYGENGWLRNKDGNSLTSEMADKLLHFKVPNKVYVYNRAGWHNVYNLATKNFQDMGYMVVDDKPHGFDTYGILLVGHFWNPGFILERGEDGYEGIFNDKVKGGGRGIRWSHAL